MNQGAFTDHVFKLNAELLKQRDDRRVEDLRKFAEQQRRMFLRWRSAADWVAKHMPDMVDEAGEVCPFATHAALDIKRAAGDHPTPDEICRYRRERWAHIREEEEVQP